MGTLEARTITQALGRMGVSDWPTESRTCVEHGEFKSTKTPGGWTDCPTCNDIRMREAEAERQRVEAAERRQQIADKLLGRAAIPPRFADRSLESYVASTPGAKNALAVATAYANAFEAMLADGSSLIFCGGVGTGKTHLAIGIARRVIDREMVAVFTSVLGAVRSVKETYRKGSDISEEQAIDRLIEPDLLILDEVGVQFGSDTEKMIMFEIINGRYEAVKPTILISNLAVKELETFIGERAFDRLREGGGRVVVFDWPSHRKQA
ncbi:ATP-binding protein [Pandoraea sp. XJJ-1]|uniref:ATP-binding protein n=1 Tax=Pandoraea sp. XJJ-1 TaxID=3002643 RepID=UPI00227F137B|nr:ATP-binding protein [Pandoraea sp. XJJ-1]WAL81333.1 ATP-binding protein [Pandoraea sp. XJJ-1]